MGARKFTLGIAQISYFYFIVIGVGIDIYQNMRINVSG